MPITGYMKKLTAPINNMQYNLISFTITNGKIKRNIIYKNIKLYNIVSNIMKINIEYPNLFNENEIVLVKKVPVLDVYYMDNMEKVSIKHIITKYADKNKNHTHNSLKNIFDIENINTNKIYVTFLKLIKKIEKEYDMSETDYHVSDIFDL
jgi:hypothetical protein